MYVCVCGGAARDGTCVLHATAHDLCRCALAKNRMSATPPALTPAVHYHRGGGRGAGGGPRELVPEGWRSSHSWPSPRDTRPAAAPRSKGKRGEEEGERRRGGGSRGSGGGRAKAGGRENENGGRSEPYCSGTNAEW